MSIDLFDLEFAVAKTISELREAIRHQKLFESDQRCDCGVCSYCELRR